MVLFKTSRLKIALITWRDHPRGGFIVIPAQSLLDAGLEIGGGAKLYDVLGIIRGPKVLLEIVNWDGADVKVPLGNWTWARGRGSFLVFATPRSVFYYASPSVVSGGDGSIGNPWSLRRALNGGASPAPGPGDTLYLRGGTYYGGFVASIEGAPGDPVMIRPQPGEIYRIEQYIVGSLTSTINSTTNDIGFTPNSGYSRDDFTSGDEFVINAPGGPGVAESCRCLSTGFTGGPGNLKSLRALNGTGVVNATQGYAHTAGALIYSSNNGITVTGDYQQWWGCDRDTSPELLSRVQCANPIRTFPIDISGNGTGPVWARCRAAFTASGVTGLEVIGLCLKDSNDGVFIAGVGGNHVVGAILAYNNGHVDEVRGHGQPCYIHTETGAAFTDVISFSNFGSGSKFFASSGTVRNCIATRVHSFNNMAPSSYVGNPITVDVMPSNKYVEGNWFMGAYDTMEDCAMYDSVVWMPYDSIEKFPNVQFGFGGVCDGFIIDNNWILGGDQGLHMKNLSNVSFTRNLMAQHTTGATAPNVQSNSNFHIDDSSSHLATWSWGTGGNINSFWDNNRWISSDTHSYSFLVAKDGTSGTNEFGSQGFQRYDVPSDSRDFLGYTGFVLDYHESPDGGTTLVLPSTPAGFMFRSAPCTHIPKRAHIAVWKCDGSAIGTFNLPAAELTACGWATGDSGIIVNALDYFAGIAGGANKITVSSWSGTSAVSIAAGSFTRENPIGFTTENWRGNTWTLGFGELILYRVPSGTPLAPIITTITPSSAVQGAVLSVTITGANFSGGTTTVTVSGTGVTVSGISVTGSTSLTATFTIAGGAAVGARILTLTTPNGSDTDTFTVNPAPVVPTLTAITPTSGQVGTAPSVTLTGTGFVVGATVAVSGSGVTVSGITVASTTSLSATFTIASGAALGARTVTVTTTGGTSGPVTFTLVPVPVPTLTSITPASAMVGTAVNVTLTGTNFVGGSTTVQVSGSGVTVSGVVISGTLTTLAATFTIASGAAVGARSVTVTTPSGGTSNAVTFTLIAIPVPTLTSIAPNSGTVGTAVGVTLTGTNFIAGSTTVQVSGAAGVTVSGVSVTGTTSIAATFTISSGAAVGARNVTVTVTPGGTSGPVTFTLTPVTVNPPTVSSISPTVGFTGSAVAVTISGANFVAGATTVSISGSGVSASAVNVTATTSLTALFTITSGAAVGARNVTVTAASLTSNSVTFTVIDATLTRGGGQHGLLTVF